ncbi:MAG: hypothetical protein PHT99_01590 [Methanoregula sp.]|nr:hypothetical protein [Methanoregula sp.]
MNAVHGTGARGGKGLSAIRTWPDRLSCRLRMKIVHFDQTIAAFRQRRWS